jgi:hypothetical protein
MSVKTTLRQAIERGESQAQKNIELYFSTVNSIAEQTGKALTKLPSGDRISPRYLQFVTRAGEVQKDALLKVLNAQTRLQTWPLREAAAEEPKPARKAPAAKA